LAEVGVIEVDIRVAEAAIEMGPALDVFVTSDDRLAGAARALGLPVVRPA
jgi:hypothetical protein